MLAGLFWHRDALFAVLAGASVAAVTHAISHITDRTWAVEPATPTFSASWLSCS